MTKQEPFDAERFERLRAARGLELGQPLVLRAVTRSTNDDAMAAARSEATHGTTFVAEHQEHGRGRRDARWFAPPCASLLASVVLRPALPAHDAGALALSVGLALRAAVAERWTAGPVLLKWPNDVWIAERKVAGVLVEAQLRGGALLGVVAGFGINVTIVNFPEDLRDKATSLALLGADCRREDLLVDALDALARELARLERGGVGALHADLTRFDALRGRRVSVDQRNGIADGIDERGRLCLIVDKQTKIALENGHVELMP